MYDRDRIVEAIDLASLADEVLGSRRGTSRSASWPCPSPQHAQTGRTPPVSLYRSRGGEERWHCHGCGIGGSAIDLVMAAHRLTVAEAIEELAGRAGVRGALDDRRPHRAVARPAKDPRSAPAATADPAGLAAFVDECAERLWKPQGRAVRRWLTEVRGLPGGVLERNRIGADPGRQAQARPDGMPSCGRATVLPVIEAGRPVFAQLRAIDPRPDGPRYLNAASRLAVNPRVGVYQPCEAVGRCVIVTEGVIDALSANAAGLRSAAVIGAALTRGGAGYRTGLVADRLARLGGPVIIAFDADQPGQEGAQALRDSLRARGTRATYLHVPSDRNDLNAWMITSPDWDRTLKLAVRTAAMAAEQPSRTLAR
ncbi:MAG TPA: toprim domain-containing protein [Egibacteraceae bacterium]|nr:toprim domain-containing protein [Egibacteraceae bacterium]